MAALLAGCGPTGKRAAGAVLDTDSVALSAPVDLDGAPVALFEQPNAKAIVLVFVMIDCPISNRYAPEIRRLHAELAPRGVDFRLVYADPDESPEAIREHLAAFEYPLGALRDTEHALVELVGATVTPEAAVLRRQPGDGRWTLAYRGRIDDTWVAYGKNRAAPTRRDLREALTAIVDGRPIEVDRTEPIGCFIPPL